MSKKKKKPSHDTAEKKEKTTESKTEEISAMDNLKDGYDQIKANYQIQSTRLKTVDEKFNMLLVFNAAIIALLIIIIPFPSAGVRHILSISIFSVFVAGVLVTLLCIFIGMYPRKLSIIDIKTYINPKEYKCSREEYIGKYIAGYEKAIDSIIKASQQKQKMVKHAMFATAINVVLIMVLMIIKISGN